jgi:sortase A
VDQLIGFLRAKRWARRSLTGGTALLVVVAVVLLGFPLYSNFVHNRLQSHLRSQLASPQLKDAYVNHRLHEGDSLTRMRIPSLNVDVVVVEGISADALRAGAGHYPGTPLPCDIGNVPIAGHRTTYGKPFADLDRLRAGDHVEFETPVGPFTYRVVAEPRPVDRGDLSVVAWSPGSTLTLTTCHPKGSARQRLVVRAELVPSGRPLTAGGG